jgi:hypothetical protein
MRCEGRAAAISFHIPLPCFSWDCARNAVDLSTEAAKVKNRERVKNVISDSYPWFELLNGSRCCSSLRCLLSVMQIKRGGLGASYLSAHTLVA